MLSGVSAFSMCSAVKFMDLAISLENSTVPVLVLFEVGISRFSEFCSIGVWDLFGSIAVYWDFGFFMEV